MRHTSVAYLNKEVLVISMKDKWKIYKIPSISGNFDLFNFKKNKKIELKYFIPKYILAGKNQKEYPLNIDDDGYYLNLDYSAKLSGKNGFFNVEKLYSLVIPKNISWINETFEVLGLLQAEMGKTNNGCVVFANHEYQIINKVIKWFEKELEITHNDWRWYIKVNLNNPKSEKYKKEVEKKVIDHWLNKAKIKKEKAYPTTVSYIKNTKNKQLRFYDYGTLIIEYKRNLLSQILKRFVKEMSYSIPKLGEEENKYFMKGILAGESSITCRKKSGHYRIHLTANESEERELYQKCLNNLGIRIFKYDNYKEMIISERENHMKLLKLRLLTLSHQKYNKFLYMIEQYDHFPEMKNYRIQFKNRTWHKIPEEKINKIIELYESGTTRTVEIAEKLGVSKIKVNRVLRENNLGKRKVKDYPEYLKKKIVRFAKNNLKISQREIAEKFNISEPAVRRALQKYGFKKTEKDRLKTPIEKINHVIKLYKEHPEIKFKDVMGKIGISDTALANIRRIYGLHRLGYYYTVGNNPEGKNQYSKAFK